MTDKLSPEMIKKIERAWLNFEETVLRAAIVMVKFQQRIEKDLKFIYKQMDEPFGAHGRGFDEWIDYLAKMYGIEDD